MDRYTPEQRRDYMRNYRDKRTVLAKEQLGSKCVLCGVKDRLEFDHIDPKTKIKAVTAMTHASHAAFEAEVAKCQLLCKDHHREKSKAESRVLQIKPIRHGTMYAYQKRGCRCELCRKAKQESRKKI